MQVHTHILSQYSRTKHRMRHKHTRTAHHTMCWLI